MKKFRMPRKAKKKCIRTNGRETYRHLVTIGKMENLLRKIPGRHIQKAQAVIHTTKLIVLAIRDKRLYDLFALSFQLMCIISKPVTKLT